MTEHGAQLSELEVYERLSKALGQRCGESLVDASSRIVSEEAPRAQIRLAAHAVLDRPAGMGPWGRLRRALRFAETTSDPPGGR